jgi:hypothetical protein
LVIKEWHCSACGLDFDSELQICARCGATEPSVSRAFRTPPGFKSDTTKVTDQSLSNFTAQYGLSDFSNNPSTKHEKNFDHLWKPASELVSAPEPGESNADVIRGIMAEAAKPITSQKVVVGKERAA